MSLDPHICPEFLRKTISAAGPLLLCLACSSDGGDGASDGGSSGSGGGAGTGGSSAAGGTGGSSGGGTGGGGAAPFEYRTCQTSERIGGFGIQVTPPTDTTPGSTQLGGSVNDKVSPYDVWDTIAEEGECQVVVGPSLSCSPGCANGEECAGNNQCITSPMGLDVGTVTVAGLSLPISANMLPNNTYYAPINAYPPFAPGDSVALTAAGADIAGFTLRGVGIEPIEVPTTTFAITPGEPLTLTWTAPSGASASRIGLSLDIAHHGNIAAKLLCDVPDTGSYTIPAAMLTALIDRGVAGFPLVNFIRRTVDSTTTASGCVDFAVASARERQLTLPGLTSCTCAPDVACDQCPEGQTCQMDYTCE